MRRRFSAVLVLTQHDRATQVTIIEIFGHFAQ